MNDQDLNYHTFVPQLLVEIPEVTPVYVEHLRQCDELLPHVLMGDVTRFVCDSYRRSVSGDTDAEQWRRVVDRSLDLMERAICSPDLMLRNLILVSFLENLIPSNREEEEVYTGVKALMGPQLQKGMAEMLEYWGFSSK